MDKINELHFKLNGQQCMGKAKHCVVVNNKDSFQFDTLYVCVCENYQTTVIT